MTNLEMELKIKALDDESLEFQQPILNEEDEPELDVLKEDDFVVTSPVREKSGLVEESAGKLRKTREKASGKATRAFQDDTRGRQDAKKEPPACMAGSEGPVIKITPFETDESENPSEEAAEDSVFEDAVKTAQEATEEFDEEPGEEPSAGQGRPFEGEVEEAGAESPKEEEDQGKNEEFVFEPCKINIARFFGMSGMVKQAASLAAVFSMLFLCFRMYGCYMEKKSAPALPVQVAETMDACKEQTEAAAAGVEHGQNVSNMTKVERLVGYTEKTAETRFRNLAELTQYINQNTMLAKEILESINEGYQAGTVTPEEYARVLSEAKSKLAELSTLLTANRQVYTTKGQTDDYNILYDNINTVNQLY